MKQETKDVLNMMITLFSILLIVVLIGRVFATEVYSGDSKIINLDKQYDYWIVVGNNTPVIDSINQDESNFNVTIVFSKYIINETFSVVFFNNTEVIKEVPTIVYSGGGGGGGSIKYVDRNVTIEVPKFYDRNITVYKDNKIIEEKIIFDDNKITLSNILRVLTMIFGFVIGSIILMYVYFKLKSNERGKIKENE